MNTTNPSQYLTRIQYNGALVPSLEVLTNLQKAHLQHVPFENLDIHLGRPILLENTYDKVVLQGRGGFCYELNSLFYELLKEIGFTVILISARVYSEYSGHGPEFDHMAIIAMIEEVEYLVDVGFGEFAFAPLKIEINKIQTDQRGDFIIDSEDGITYIVRKKTGEKFVPQYSFTKRERVVNDFLEMCHYHQTNPESHFTQKRLCSLPTEHGRVSLTGNVLKITEGDRITEMHLQSEEEVKEILWKYFGMRVELTPPTSLTRLSESSDRPLPLI